MPSAWLKSSVGTSIKVSHIVALCVHEEAKDMWRIVVSCSDGSEYTLDGKFPTKEKAEEDLGRIIGLI